MAHPEVMGDVLIHSYQILLNDPKVQAAVKHYQVTHKLPAFCAEPKAANFDYPVIS
jgi:hypothetical protein